MLIEACDFLRPTLKAKLQDSGVLYVSDMHELLARSGVGGDGHDASASPPQRASLSSSSTTTSPAAGGGDGNSSNNVSNRGATPSPPPPLPPRTLQQLQQHLPSLTPRELAELVAAASRARNNGHDDDDKRDVAAAPAGCTMRSLRDLYAAAAAAATATTTTATAPAASVAAPPHVTTFSRDLDALLGGGGVRACAVTELCGPPGAGKTQLLLQLAVSAVLPRSLGGLDGDSLFVDTEGSFVPERLYQVAVAAVTHVKDIAYRQAAMATAATTTAATTTTTTRVACKRERSPCVHNGSGGDAASAAARRAIMHNVDTDEDSSNSNSVAVTADKAATTTTTAAAASSSSMRTDASPDLAVYARRLTVDYVLQRVHHVRITDVASLMAFLYALPDALGTPQAATATAAAAAAATVPCTSDKKKADLSRVKMLLIDSIAQPFRAFASLSTSDVVATAAAGGGERERRERLWRRSRLLFACAQRLQEYAATYSLTVVVSNQVTSRLVYLPETEAAAPYASTRTANNGNNNNNMSAVRARASWPASSSSSSARRVTVLIPALGDAWAYGLSTRLLLSFHHYLLPPTRCKVENVAVCHMQRGGDIDDAHACTSLSATTTTNTTAAAAAAAAALDDVQQHRVARLLKSTSEPRGECCFAITRRGIRDVRALAAHARY